MGVRANGQPLPHGEGLGRGRIGAKEEFELCELCQSMERVSMGQMRERHN